MAYGCNFSKVVSILTKHMKLLPLQGARQTALIPRALPWARSFCPFRACGGQGDYSIAAQTLRNQSSFLPLISAMDKFSLFTSSGSNS